MRFTRTVAHRGGGVFFIGATMKIRVNAVDDSVFDAWNERSAYLLGVVYAEGYVSPHPNRNDVRIGLSTLDEDWLNCIKSAFHSESKISRRIDQRTGKSMSNLVFTSLQIKQALINFGIRNRSMPPVPDCVFHHFARGHFDGDGSFYIDRQCGNLHTNFVGVYHFIKLMRDRLASLAQLTAVNLQPKSNSNVAWSIRYASRDTLKLGKFMYQNSTIQLTRKQSLFLNEKVRKEG